MLGLPHGQTKAMLLRPMALKALQDTLASAFGLDEAPLGIRSAAEDAVFPMSLLARNPALFSNGATYDLVVDQQGGDVNGNGNGNGHAPAAWAAGGRRAAADRRAAAAPRPVAAVLTESLAGTSTGDLIGALMEVSPEGRLTPAALFTALAQRCEGASRDEVERAVSLVFSIFAPAHGATALSVEVASALSAFCSDAHTERYERIFALYDRNGDGVLSAQEILAFVLCVLKMYGALYPGALGESLEELASHTVSHIMREADADGDGSISFAEFIHWQQQMHQTNLAAETDRAYTLAQLRTLLDLQRFSPESVVTYILEMQAAYGESGPISRDVFAYSLLRLVQGSAAGLEDDQIIDLADCVFRLFDLDGSGSVDAVELLSGVSLLCHDGNVRGALLRPAFALFDEDGDGYLTKDQLRRYLCAVLRFNRQQNKAEESYLGSPELLAEVTAEECFQDVALDGRGQVSVDDFSDWVQAHRGSASGRDEAGAGAGAGERRSPALLEAEAAKLHLVQLQDVAALMGAASEVSPRDAASILQQCGADVRQCYAAAGLVAAVPGSHRCGAHAAGRGAALAALSLGCGGSRTARAEIVFAAYDSDCDGTLSEAELAAYMEVALGIFYGGGAQQREMAAAAAGCVAVHSRLRHQGRIGFDDFRTAFVTGVEEGEALSAVDCARLGFMFRVPFEVAAQAVATGAAADGTISELALLEGMRDPIARFAATKDDARHMLEATGLLYAALEDFEGQPRAALDARDVLSALTLLCGGSPDTKARVVFDAYDESASGFIVANDLLQHLLSMYCVRFAGVRDVDVVGLARDMTLRACGAGADRMDFASFRRCLAEAHAHSGLEGEDVSVTLAEAVRMANVASLPIAHFAEHMKDRFSASEVLSREDFLQSFTEFVERYGEESNGSLVALVGARLFTILDANEDGVVDHRELVLGLSLLLGGPDDSAAETVFEMYDEDGDGYITVDEVFKYLTAALRLLQQKGGEQPDEKANLRRAATLAHEIFDEADTNHDGYLSLEEFSMWFLTPFAAELHSMGDVETLTLQSVRRMTKLAKVDVEDALRQMLPHMDDWGRMDLATFKACFGSLVQQDRAAGAGGVPQQRLARRIRSAVGDRLFDCFDVNKDGFIDREELTAVLTVLCGGGRRAKLGAVRRLFAEKADGVFSREDLVRYMKSVFTVSFALAPQMRRDLNGVEPGAFAEATVDEAFEAAGAGDVMTFEQFCRWHDGKDAEEAHREASEALAESLRNARALTGLGDVGVPEMLDTFAEAADREGYISRYGFFTRFAHFFPADADEAEIKALLNALFSAFDTEGKRLVDFSELVTGLTLLCSGHAEMKTRSAFALYDTNGDGFISVDEMMTYLTSVYTVLLALMPGEQPGATAIQLASRTTEKAFLLADANRDGFLSYGEFVAWCGSSPEDDFEKYAKQLATAEDGGPGVGGNGRAAPADPAGEALRPLSLAGLRDATGLGRFSPDEVLPFFAEAAEGASLRRDAFKERFAQLLSATDGADEADGASRMRLLDRLFDAFDRDGNGEVSFAELLSGLSVLCGGSREERLRAAFEIFDTNGDGFISFAEMATYLTSLYTLLQECGDGGPRAADAPAEELGWAMAESVFRAADADGDGQISLGEFRRWYDSDGASVVVPEWLTLEAMRDVAKLDRATAGEVFEAFAAEANEYNLLDRSAFNRAFLRVADRSSPGRLRVVLAQLFDVFDVDQSGYIDFVELASAVSVLCGGSPEEKVAAAFGLYEGGEHGEIERDDAVRYMAAVFRLLLALERRDSAAPSPLEYASRTVERTFPGGGRVTAAEFTRWYSSGAEQSALEDTSPMVRSARKQLRMGCHSIEEVVEALAEGAPDGVFTEHTFCAALLNLVQLGGVDHRSGDFAAAAALARTLYRSYCDAFGSDHAPFTEVACALVCLAVASLEDRIAAASSALAPRGGGTTFTMPNLTLYFTALFATTMALQARFAKPLKDFNPRKVARATAASCFERSGAPLTGSVTVQQVAAFARTSALGTA